MQVLRVQGRGNALGSCVQVLEAPCVSIAVLAVTVAVPSVFRGHTYQCYSIGLMQREAGYTEHA